VNFPSCSLEPSGGVRLLVANKNVPNMLSQILAVLADENLNVEDMVNRHRDGIAFNIIDLSAACISNSAMAQLSGIEGVVMTRQVCR
jgi:D-3-phosphoglycerate dehydrogenase